MTFELLPTIDVMIDLYEQPRTVERFQAYLKILQGNSNGDLVFPVGGFNPMAKEHLIEKLKALKNLGTEQIIAEIAKELNSKYISENPKRNFKIALNLLDDLHGGWTNHYTSDYSSKFEINGLISRDFCTPIFWASEDFSKELIRERVLAYAFRTRYWLTHQKPRTLKEHVEQEAFVAKSMKTKKMPQVKNLADLDGLDHFYKLHKDSDNYHLIFNFFYGNKASKSLEFPTFGNEYNATGFDYSVALYSF